MHRSSVLYLSQEPGKAISLEAYVETARAGVTADDLHRFPLLGEQIKAKLLSEQARQHRDLHDGLDVLCKFLSSPRAQRARDPLPQDIAEAIVALDYFLEVFDLIPDAALEIGLTDDARIVACVLARNPSIYL